MSKWYFSTSKTGGLYVFVETFTPDDALRAKVKLYGVGGFEHMFSEAEWKREIVRNYNVTLYEEIKLSK